MSGTNIHSDNGPKLKEVAEEMKGQQQKGDYLNLFGVYSGSSTDYGITSKREGGLDKLKYDNTNYSFYGADSKFVSKLISYGYSNHEVNSDELSICKHLTLVFQKK